MSRFWKQIERNEMILFHSFNPAASESYGRWKKFLDKICDKFYLLIIAGYISFKLEELHLKDSIFISLCYSLTNRLPPPPPPNHFHLWMI